MWLLKEIRTEMRLGRIDKILTEKEIYKKCIDNGINPRICTSSDNKIFEFAITDEDFDKLFKLKNPNVQ